MTAHQAQLIDSITSLDHKKALDQLSITELSYIGCISRTW